jgi:hypothetical protein
MGKSSNQKQAERNNLAIQQAQLEELKKANAHREAIFNMLSPFGTSALNIGSDALKGIAPNAFLLPQTNAISSAFNQGRQNLAEALGASGQSGSGISAGPLANMENDQAVASGNARLQAILQGLNVGFQGANALQGQQSIFDPNGLAGTGTNAGQSVIQAPGGFGSQLLGGIIGAGAKAGFSWLTKGT